MLCGFIQPWQTEKDINSPRATLVGFGNAIYLQRQHPSIKYTPLHAVKTSGHPVKGSELNLYEPSNQVNHIIEGCYYREDQASMVEVTVTVDIYVKVPLFSRASLAETTVATATRRTTTVPTTQEWKLKGI